MAVVTPPEWDHFLTRFPDAHLLQTGAWGALKADFGWEVEHFVSGGAGAQVLFRKLPLGFRLAYIPRGPVWGAGGQLYGGQADQSSPAAYEAACRDLHREIDDVCRQRRVVLLKVEPDLWEMQPPDQAPPPPGFRLSPQSIQPPRTILVDISGEEDRVLGRMKQKTRYNIRLALKKGVVVRPSADLELFHRLMQVTGGRDSFGVHSLAYYRRAYELFYPQGAGELLLAEYEGEPLAALMVFAHGRRAWYLFGASSNEHRERMPTYLLQWEAMRWARSRGCTQYDLWGVPDVSERVLEEDFTRRSDGLWGVYRFKRGFGGELCRAAGTWDRVYQPALYWFYRLWAQKRAAA